MLLCCNPEYNFDDNVLLSDFASRMSGQQYEHTKPLNVKCFTKF